MRSDRMLRTSDTESTTIPMSAVQEPGPGLTQHRGFACFPRWIRVLQALCHAVPFDEGPGRVRIIRLHVNAGRRVTRKGAGDCASFPHRLRWSSPAAESPELPCGDVHPPAPLPLPPPGRRRASAFWARLCNSQTVAAARRSCGSEPERRPVPPAPVSCSSRFKGRPARLLSPSS